MRNLQSLFELVRDYPLLRGAVAAPAVGLLLMAWQYYGKLSPRARQAAAVLAVAMTLLGLAANLAMVFSNLRQPRDWDVLCLWTFGQLVAEGRNPYDINLIRERAEPYNPSPEFQEQNYCLYPPPCLVAFAPLGLLPFWTAMLVWYVLLGAVMAVAILHLWRWLDPERTWLGLAVTSALTLTMQSTIHTFFYGQTVPLILAAVLMAVDATGPVMRGLMIGVATIIKPIGAILAIDLVVKRDWQAIVCLAAVPIAAGLLFVLIDGREGIDGYWHAEPLPEAIRDVYFKEPMNQSLLSVLLRALEASPGQRPFLFPPFVAVAGALTAVTLLVLIRLPADLQRMGLAYVLALALLVYPVTRIHYSLCLLVPLGLAWRFRDKLPAGPTLAIAVWIAVTFCTWSRFAFAANLIVWSVLTVQLGLATGAPWRLTRLQQT